MRKFKISVDNVVYDVAVEEVDANAVQSQASAAPAAAAAQTSSAIDDDLMCTLAGVVESVNVNVGQHVNAGEVVVMLEVMKMKTAMEAHKSGKVTAVAVKPGDKVESGQVLIKIS